MIRNKRLLTFTGLFAVAVFAFAFGLTTATPVAADQNYCCELQPPGCQQGIGVIKTKPYFQCVYDVNDPRCLDQAMPICH